MPLDFRYHLASLAAVFSALLIGILVGVAMKEGPGLTNQVEGLRKEFRRSQSLLLIDKKNIQFDKRTQGMLVRNRLWGRNVLLVQDPTVFPTDQVGEVRQVLQQAGATVIAEVVLKPSLLQLSPKQLATIYRRAGRGLPNTPCVEDLMCQLAEDLVHGSTAMALPLREEKCLRVKGNPGTPFSTVIFLGGTTVAEHDALYRVDLPFIKTCEAGGLRVVTAETFNPAASAATSYKKVASVTIDNIDRVAGRVAMVWALANNQHGHFGYRDDADAVVPEVE
ncbi:MAG TPA: copper transporter [Armatimonadota bacterium]